MTQPPGLGLSSPLAPRTRAQLLCSAQVLPCPPAPPSARTPLVPIEVVQAVHLILAVQGEALIPDAPGAGHTREAGWVEGLAQGPDDVFSDHLATLATLLQGVLGQRAIASEVPTRVPTPAHKGLLTSSEGAQEARGTGEEPEFMQLAYNYHPPTCTTTSMDQAWPVSLAYSEESCHKATTARFVTGKCRGHCPLGPTEEIPFKSQSQEKEFLEKLACFFS